MSYDKALLALAHEAGLETRWTDTTGKVRRVGIDTLRTALTALDAPANSRAAIGESRVRLRNEKGRRRPLIVTRTSGEIVLDGGKIGELESEYGERKTVRLHERGNGQVSFRAPQTPGYYRLETGGLEVALAIAPARAWMPKDVAPGRFAGVSVQIYSLRGGSSGDFGDFAALGNFAGAAGRGGFDAVMASPAHALFGSDVAHFNPYSPSTRLFLNPLFADTTLAGGDRLAEPRGNDALIDWKKAGEKKQRALREAFARFRRAGNRRQFETYCRKDGERLLAHALFEVLDDYFRKRGIADFRRWPAGFESPTAARVSEFAKKESQDVEYQLFLQWLSAISADAAQAKARRSMAIGIISDLAVGMDPLGSHAWSAPHELLRGLHVGAPPDAFNAPGQDWGLTALSPQALYRFGFGPFIATLRAAMRHAGGVRIDHALGLRRLWLVPAGASPTEGVYLRYPQDEMLSLIALESHRHRGVVVGEDLGTVPKGFRADLGNAGILGMQVLWFERAGALFVKPSAWRQEALATTTTHDLPTVAGWWKGHDIDQRVRAGHLGQNEQHERRERAANRERLWTALKNARCATGTAPSPDNCEKALQGALAYVGRARCTLAFAPIEDFTADVEQPNLPGTIDEHPNWRRRMKKGDVFRDAAVRARVQTFLAARRG